MVIENTCLTFRYLTYPFKLRQTNIPQEFQDNPIILYITATNNKQEGGFLCEAYISYYHFREMYMLDQFKMACSIDNLPKEMSLLADNIAESERYANICMEELQGKHYSINRVF